ncbi:MAG: hypothetical protein ACTHJ0_02095 [Flavipsychrobacter sp.]
MKTVLLALAAVVISTTTMAQNQSHVVENKTTVKHTSTVPQKVHNTFSRHKRYTGVKVKHKKVVEKTETK